jgi:hypothetical protein
MDKPGDLMRWWLSNRGDLDHYVDADLERSCGSKVSYSSEADARAHMAMNGMKLSTYHCHYCDGWHLTRRQS